MKILVTGASGTLGPHLVRSLQAHEHTCVAWDRSAVSPDDRGACVRFLADTNPDAIAHLALGAEAWAEQLAAWCSEHQRPLLCTSTAMVFGNDPDGPHRPADERSGQDGYGQYKARCEDQILAAHPSATVARIGWQIATDRTGGNNMLEHLHTTHDREGHIEASQRWTPACSFLEDTGDALRALLEAPTPGVVHLDGNAEPAWTYLQIVKAIRTFLGDPTWTITPTDDYTHDQRLLDDVVRVSSIADRLSGPMR